MGRSIRRCSTSPSVVPPILDGSNPSLLDFNVSIPSLNTASSILDAFTNNMVICMSGSYPGVQVSLGQAAKLLTHISLSTSMQLKVPWVQNCGHSNTTRLQATSPLNGAERTQQPTAVKESLSNSTRKQVNLSDIAWQLANYFGDQPQVKQPSTTTTSDTTQAEMKKEQRLLMGNYTAVDTAE